MTKLEDATPPMGAQPVTDTPTLAKSTCSPSTSDSLFETHEFGKGKKEYPQESAKDSVVLTLHFSEQRKSIASPSESHKAFGALQVRSKPEELFLENNSLTALETSTEGEDPTICPQKNFRDEKEEEKKEEGAEVDSTACNKLDDIQVKSSFFVDEYELVVPSSMSNLVSSDDQEKKSIYIRNTHYGWLAGTVLEEHEGQSLVQVHWPDPATTVVHNSTDKAANLIVRHEDYPGGKLPLQNLQAKRDMVDLVHLHEAAILFNLMRRHANLQPYTRVGDILVAMNPFQWVDSLYTAQLKHEYAHTIFGKDFSRETDLIDYKCYFDRIGMEPHVYEVSALAYRGLATDGKDQTILVTGESGAGKTETVKILMSHLATIPKNSAMDIVTLVCQSSPAFEAFGNAKTLKNDNSSRFGKFIQMQFRVESSHAEMLGTFCTTYLLEKTRVVSHSLGERTYHIFYQLMAAPKEFKEGMWPFFASYETSDFAYLGQSGDFDSQLHLDAEQWIETTKALSLFEFSGEALYELMRAVGIVLQLGNLVFKDGKCVEEYDHGIRQDGEYDTVIASKLQLQRLSHMTGIEMQELEDSMTCRVLKTGSEDLKVKASPHVAKEWCDALAKEIYARIFDTMVRRINESTAVGHDVENMGYISLLDIFGFERFDVNRFEQLCINYANEKLHNKYVLDNFNEVKEEYEAEGVDLYDFSLVDNSDVLELLESRGGLLSSLNEECYLPRGKNDELFVSKAKRNHKKRDSFINEMLLHNRTQFGVRHFAGPVVYDAQKFVERNMDKLPEGIVKCAAKTCNSLIRAAFQTASQPDGPQNNRTSFKRNRFVLEEFQAQLRSLMSAMENSQTRYIRCIKPNSLLAPKKTDYQCTLRQLECSGIMAAIAITRESYPNKLPYEVIGERFACLMRENSVNNTDEINSRQQVEYILPKRLNPDSFRCGKTMVYFKAGAKEQLEVLRLEYLNAAATVIQKGVRRVLAMESYSKALKAIFKIQTSWRMTIEKRLLSQKIRSATCLSAAVRRHLATRKVAIVRQERAVTRIQTKFRTIHNAQQLRIARHAAKSIQRYVRRLQALQHIKAFKRALLELQSLWRMRSQLRICNRQKSSATQLASLFRAVLAAKLVVKMRRERDAAMKIQVVARLFITKRKYAYRSHVLSIKGVAASLIQSAYRAHNRRGCNRLLKQGMSAKMAPTEPERSDSCKRSGVMTKLLEFIDQACCPPLSEFEVHPTLVPMRGMRNGRGGRCRVNSFMSSAKTKYNAP